MLLCHAVPVVAWRLVDSLMHFDCRYGPFWVATTLVFVIAATGNYANYVSYKKKHSGTSSVTQVWYSNVDKVQYPMRTCCIDCSST